MSKKVLYIKNMVCNRCVKVVKDELEKLELKVNHVILGEAEIDGEFDLNKIKDALEKNGFEILDDKQTKLIEKIKIAVIELIRSKEGEELFNINTSGYLSNRIGMSYQYLSSLFSSLEGITIEKYLINQKIEKVKEYLVYDELTLSEIAYKLGYSSVQHLSNQFKKTTGFSPSEFKKLKEKTRLPLDEI